VGAPPRPALDRPHRPSVGSSSGGKGRIHVFLSLGAITAVAFAEPPLDQLAALGGATGGSLLIYIAPALMTLRLASRPILPRSESGSFIIAADIAADTESEAPSDAAHGYRGPVAGAYAAVLWAMAAMGVVLAGAGSYSALQARDRPSDLQSGLDEADPETDTGEEEEGTPALEPPATKGVGGATASLAIAAPAATHSRRRAVRQMLICALPAGKLPSPSVRLPEVREPRSSRRVAAGAGSRFPRALRPCGTAATRRTAAWSPSEGELPPTNAERTLRSRRETNQCADEKAGQEITEHPIGSTAAAPRP